MQRAARVVISPSHAAALHGFATIARRDANRRHAGKSGFHVSGDHGSIGIFAKASADRSDCATFYRGVAAGIYRIGAAGV